MKKITIHTATYNRGYILGKAYESLKAQTCKDFEWIITDDGSTDNTAELITKWIEETKDFDIIYNPLKHLGIPRALNSGVNLANTDWFMILDSDDHLLPNTVEKVIGWIKEIENDNQFVGIGYARCFPNGEFMKNQTPIIDPNIGYIDATNIERKKYNLDMDMVEVSRVSVLKAFPFQFWENEIFAPEQLNYNLIALNGYKYRWRSERLYICDYLPDGLTRNDKIVKNNPMGFAMMHNQNLLIHETFKEKFQSAIQMIALSLCSGNAKYLLKSNNKTITALAFPLGAVLSVRRRIQFKNMDK